MGGKWEAQSISVFGHDGIKNLFGLWLPRLDSVLQTFQSSFFLQPLNRVIEQLAQVRCFVIVNRVLVERAVGVHTPTVPEPFATMIICSGNEDIVSVAVECEIGSRVQPRQLWRHRTQKFLAVQPVYNLEAPALGS
jgi:hypothetical protein